MATLSQNGEGGRGIDLNNHIIDFLESTKTIKIGRKRLKFSNTRMTIHGCNDIMNSKLVVIDDDIQTPQTEKVRDADNECCNKSSARRKDVQRRFKLCYHP